MLIGALLIPMTLTSVLEIASIGAVLPLVQVALDPNSTQFRDLIPDLSEKNLLAVVAIGFAALFVLKNTFILFVTYLISRVIFGAQANFQQKMFHLYMYRPYEYHLRKNSAELIRDLSNSIGTAFEAIRLSMVFVMDFFLASAAFAAMLIFEPQITLAVSGALIVLGAVFYLFVGPLLHRWGQISFGIEADLIRSIKQSFGALKTVRAHGNEAYFERRFADQTHLSAQVRTRSVTASQSPRFVIETFVVLFSVGGIGLFVSFDRGANEILPTVGLFVMAGLRLMPTMNRMLAAMVEIRHRTAPVDSIHKDLTDGISSSDPEREYEPTAGQALQDALRFENVSFKYEGAERNASVLHRLNFQIPAHQSVGLVGPSGAGKSTIVDLILGLLKPTDGQVLIDGKSIHGTLNAWQSQIGYVPQDISFTDDTLRRNIAFGIEDDKIDEQRIISAVKMSGLSEFVESLEIGLDTFIGEDGTRLSGGQRQRIGIARALYRDPPLLIFDEATSSLDNQTERAISESIQVLSGNKTVFIVAHRLSTVEKCDQIIFIQNGEVSGIGPYAELKSHNAAFEEFVKTTVQKTNNGAKNSEGTTA